MTGSVDVTNDSGDINIAGKAGDSTTTNVYISAGSALGVGNINISGATTASTEVQMLAGANVGTGNITSPNVQINLNQFGITGTNTFLLGGGGSNGTGLIDATPVSGNYGEIYITNGA
ncbi:MAG: hypothetical protein P4L53_28175, partial [Candidatus Obscuribacterales bacterium]|nr:hypothetical protein [Candidatus Obscuribacterales bacterium]